MPSRKKLAGKARKAKKNDALEDQDHFLGFCMTTPDGEICNHGCEPIPQNHICYQFILHFKRELEALYDEESNDSKVVEVKYLQMIERFGCNKLYKKIWNNKANQKRLYKILVNVGTDTILIENFSEDRKSRMEKFASVLAVAAIYARHGFDKASVLGSLKSRSLLRDLTTGGLKVDTVKYFYKRSPCQCLKGKYNQIKLEPKIMVCQYCFLQVERKHLYLCGRCRFVHYCSKSCQMAHYPSHQGCCGVVPIIAG